MFYKKTGEVRPIEVVSKKLWELVMGDLPFYVDLVHIKKDKSPHSDKAIWSLIARTGSLLGLTLIPVTGFYRKGTDYHELVGSIAREYGKGACIRLTPKDLIRPSFVDELKQTAHNVEALSSRDRSSH